MAPTKPAPMSWAVAPDGSSVGYQLDIELVEDAMLRAGMTRASLARAAETSPGYITDVLTGRRQPSATKVKAIADALNCHPRSLLLRAVVRDGAA